MRKFKSWLKAIRNTILATDLTGLDRLLVFFDIIYCHYFLHCSYDEYIFYHFYRLKNNYRKKFLLEYHQRHKYKYINPTGFTRSKYGFYKKIEKCFHREIILAPDCGVDGFLEFVTRHKKIVIKPDGGSYGRSIEMFEYLNDEQSREFFSRIINPTICEEFISQNFSLSEFNPASVNTIRIVSLCHNQNVEIISATLKVGNSQNSFVDNMHGGGICASVDIETGIIYTLGGDYSGNRYYYHPRTLTPFLGFNIPNWDIAKCLVKEAHLCLSECPLLGWDIAITENGADIVEANNCPGPLLMQLMDNVPKGNKILSYIKTIRKSKR